MSARSSSPSSTSESSSALSSFSSDPGLIISLTNSLSRPTLQNLLEWFGLWADHDEFTPEFNLRIRLLMVLGERQRWDSEERIQRNLTKRSREGGSGSGSENGSETASETEVESESGRESENGSGSDMETESETDEEYIQRKGLVKKSGVTYRY